MNPKKVTEAGAEFKNFLREKGHSNSTIVAYGKDIEQLVSFLEVLKKNQIHEVTKEDIEAFLAKIPMKRMGEPDDIGKAVLFLASDMSSYMTGSQIVVDGGALLS